MLVPATSQVLLPMMALSHSLQILPTNPITSFKKFIRVLAALFLLLPSKSKMLVMWAQMQVHFAIPFLEPSVKSNYLINKHYCIKISGLSYLRKYYKALLKRMLMTQMKTVS